MSPKTTQPGALRHDSLRGLKFQLSWCQALVPDYKLSGLHAPRLATSSPRWASRAREGPLGSIIN